VRLVGAAAVKATLVLNDGAGTPVASLRVDAKSAGQWANNLTVEVAAGSTGGTYVLIIRENGAEVERSPDLTTQQDAVNWALLGSEYVNISILTSTLPPAVHAASPLATGADDRASIAEGDWQAGLARFTLDYGPGQVSMPGRTTDTSHLNLLQHAVDFNRVALLDAPDTSSVSSLKTSASAARAGGNGRVGAMFWPWLLVPGVTTSTQRTVPPSAMVAGRIASNDQQFNPNVPSAGVNGLSQYALGVSQEPAADSDREDLNEAGVDVIRLMFNSIRIYGWRSLADPTAEPDWTNFGNSRLGMAIQAQASVIAEEYVLQQIDGQGLLISEFGGELSAMLLGFYSQGALYGATSDLAFAVNVGDQVNTPSTIADGELHAVLGVRMSPFAELVQIDIVKVALTEAVI
jgi:hypothetical protein